MAALERLRARIPDDVPVIGDGKRGDIGSTSVRQSVAYFDSARRRRGHDQSVRGRGRRLRPTSSAPTGSRTSCAERRMRARPTSSPSGSHPPGTRMGRSPRRTSRSGPALRGSCPPGVRAERPGSSSAPPRPRSSGPHGPIAPGLAFLVPGVGAQGGAIDPVLASGPATAAPAAGRPGGGLLVNVSRGIASAASADGSGNGNGRPRPGVSRRPPAPGRRSSLCYRSHRPNDLSAGH